MAWSAAASHPPTMPSRGRAQAPPPLSSRPFFHRRSRSGWSQSPPSAAPARSRSASKWLDRGSNVHTDDLHDDPQPGETSDTIRTGGDVAALIDFLRNHPPPPHNFMSAPHDADGEEERGRWSTIKKMGRRSKSVPRAPHTIRLPDSAVSGVTTGGHRHIAISIPLEASPFGQNVRSQYPVCPQRNLSMGIPSKEPVQTYTNDKGVVTVLRPVVESCDSSTALASQLRSPYSGGQWPLGQEPRALHHRSGSLSGKPHDYIGILPTRFDTPLLDDSSAPWNLSQSRGEGPGRTGQSMTFQRSGYPSRASSMMASRNMRQTASIDGLISRQRSCQSGTCGARCGRNSTTTANDPAPDINAPNECAAKQSKPGKPTKPTLAVTSSQPSGIKRHDSTYRSLTVISDNPIVSRKADSPPAPGSPKSRRDAVRDKKRRDMEAVRKAKHQKLHGQEPGAADSTAAIFAGQSNDKRGQAKEDSNDASAPNLTMSSVMVVMNVEPDLSAEEHARLPTETVLPASKPPTGALPNCPRRVPSVKDLSLPTPPVSAGGTPPQSAIDRTSLTRRREWKAIREQERNAREGMALARAKTQQLASGSMSYEGSYVSQAEKEVLRLCEAYREHRLKDMERRLRRLERNGDVWMQALIPVLDNMNETMAAAAAVEEPMDADRDWASDDDAASLVRRIGRDAERRKVTKRTSMSPRRLLEKLAKHGQDGEDSWNDRVSKDGTMSSGDMMSRSEDMSGLSTIEPLMRELAGEARRRQSTTTARTLALSDERVLHAL